MKIEKNIPIPAAAHRGARIWPFADMQVGDSVLIPMERAKPARSAATTLGKRRGFRFVTRAVDGGLRVWRSA